MNVICILLDSLRADHLGCYGNTWIETPNIDRLAKESVVFENAYPEALPTVPIRTSLLTGQHTLLYRTWQPLLGEDVSAPEIFKDRGYTTAMITDVYHLFKSGMNFHRGFDVFRWIRGQEADAWESAPHGKNLDDYANEAIKKDRVMGVVNQYLKNTAHFEREEDYFCAQVIQESLRWVNRNATNEPFFLWVDSFDPHEPWDPPKRHDKYGDPAYRGPRLIQPRYGDISYLTAAELRHIRALYAGEVTFADHWVGVFLDRLRELGLLDRSIVVFLADHGHPLGDHGSILKTPDNLYSELLRIPLMIRLPDAKHAGQRIKALVQTHDLLPTLLDLCGLSIEASMMHGKSIWPVITGEKSRIRDHIVTGYHESGHRCVRTEEWSFISRADAPDELYNLIEDPGEKRNRIGDKPDLAAELNALIPRQSPQRREDYRGRFLARLRFELAGEGIQQAFEFSGTPVRYFAERPSAKEEPPAG